MSNQITVAISDGTDRPPIFHVFHEATEVSFNQPSQGWIRFIEPDGKVSWFQMLHVLSVTGYTPKHQTVMQPHPHARPITNTDYDWSK